MSGRSLWQLFLLLPAVCFSGTVHAQTPTNNPASTNKQAQIAALNAEMNQAMNRVRLIVNQPVTRLARQRGMQVREFTPGWFHEGAARPNFNTADVRASQELVYGNGYVTSDLNPGVVFVGSQLEFNSQTKFFYTDRSLPKKKLTEPEMLEINRLYRVIGKCQQQLDALENPPLTEASADSETDSTNEVSQTGWTFSLSRVPRSRLMLAGGAIVVLIVLYAVYKKSAR